MYRPLWWADTSLNTRLLKKSAPRSSTYTTSTVHKFEEVIMEMGLLIHPWQSLNKRLKEKILVPKVKPLIIGLGKLDLF